MPAIIDVGYHYQFTSDSQEERLKRRIRLIYARPDVVILVLRIIRSIMPWSGDVAGETPWAGVCHVV